MKLSMLPIVQRTDLARKRIERDVEALEKGDFAVVIDGERQDAAMLALVKPVIQRELQGRIASLERDLESYGVEVS